MFIKAWNLQTVAVYVKNTSITEWQRTTETTGLKELKFGM